jgi:D-alanyl-D-alanine carboxypeptidase
MAANFMLGRFKGADGMKTGYVCASGFNLSASATQNGRTLIAVVLGTNSQIERTDKAANLLAAGFNGAFKPIGMLNTYKPRGFANPNPIDVSKSVCGPKGAQLRQKEPSIKAKNPFKSPHMFEMGRMADVEHISVSAPLTTVPTARPKPLKDVE